MAIGSSSCILLPTHVFWIGTNIIESFQIWVTHLVVAITLIKLNWTNTVIANSLCKFRGTKICMQLLIHFWYYYYYYYHYFQVDTEILSLQPNSNWWMKEDQVPAGIWTNVRCTGNRRQLMSGDIIESDILLSFFSFSLSLDHQANHWPQLSFSQPLAGNVPIINLKHWHLQTSKYTVNTGNYFIIIIIIIIILISAYQPNYIHANMGTWFCQ